MRRLSDTIQRLAKARVSAAMVPPTPAGGTGRLRPLIEFGTNPGQLRGFVHVPETLPARPALVVVLHGCTQTAAAYDAGSGWSRLADRHGFIVLFPEQQRANNPNLCFNWFAPADTRRDGGEAASIRQMVAKVAEDHDVDPARIFVTGLSAGGAMTSALLATYPDVFAGGAIIAGLPHGSAGTVGQALERMRSHGRIDREMLGDAVRRASDHHGPWPIVSIWHGGADTTVHPDNADAIRAQWQAVHSIDGAPAESDASGTIRHRVWRDAAGRAVIEDYALADMGHGTPLDPRGDGGEVAGPHMLDMGISSTRRIAAFWGLTDDASDRPRAATKPRSTAAHSPAPSPAALASGSAKLIEDALRSAGLLR